MMLEDRSGSTKVSFHSLRTIKVFTKTNDCLTENCWDIFILTKALGRQWPAQEDEPKQWRYLAGTAFVVIAFFMGIAHK